MLGVRGDGAVAERRQGGAVLCCDSAQTSDGILVRRLTLQGLEPESLDRHLTDTGQMSEKIFCYLTWSFYDLFYKY